MVNSSQSPKQSGNIPEIFSGIQGEGLYVGARQIFVRLSGCNLNCSFCDTPHARKVVESCRIEQTAGQRDFITTDNPLCVYKVVDSIRRLETYPGMHHSIAITGGEPLFQPEFTIELARELKNEGFKIFIETNGSLPDVLPGVIPYADIISMDIKLSESTNDQGLMKRHEQFLTQSKSADVYVKIVVTSSTQEPKLLGAAKLIKSIDAEIPLILQPVTPVQSIHPPSPEQMLEWQAQCSRYLRDVRVIPQCHKIMGQL